MKKIFLISLMILLLGGLAASCAQKNTEFPLIDYKIAIKEGEIEFIVFIDGVGIRSQWIKIRGIDVRLRSDGKDYTSIVVEDNDRDIILIYDKGTILVPIPDDVEKWQNWLNKKKVEILISPKRILPPIELE